MRKDPVRHTPDAYLDTPDNEMLGAEGDVLADIFSFTIYSGGYTFKAAAKTLTFTASHCWIGFLARM